MNWVGVWDSKMCREWMCRLGCAHFKGKFHRFGGSKSSSWFLQRTGTLCFPKSLNTNHGCCPWECSRDQILAVVRKTLSRLWWNKKTLPFLWGCSSCRAQGQIWSSVSSEHSQLSWWAEVCALGTAVVASQETGPGLTGWILSHDTWNHWGKQSWRNQGPKLLSFHLPVQFWKLHLW